MTTPLSGDKYMVLQKFTVNDVRNFKKYDREETVEINPGIIIFKEETWENNPDKPDTYTFTQNNTKYADFLLYQSDIDSGNIKVTNEYLSTPTGGRRKRRTNKKRTKRRKSKKTKRRFRRKY